ncbi:DUF1127 domain-containing protein [Acidisoma cellulosilytica]|uniref:DUF1127 domain-containing protein n=1 Tax=Acidisoma cellulosilyticum TaxID=2802395 RepID=A0A963Z1B6_9PROT|nr:hypothetical protein [Acidisoma cellulosilyticum]MCB8880704.1 DUF1127 domain-containing protein [Acidisoma cellulosilyticum]
MNTISNTEQKLAPGGIKDAFDFLGLTAFVRGVFSLRQVIADHRAERAERMQMARELATYSDAELGELGFSRADLPAIVNGSYRR